MSFNSMADCSRYYIIYIENQTDGDIYFEYKEKEYAIKMDHLKYVQKQDLQNIIADSRTPVDVFTLTHGDQSGEIEVVKEVNKYESMTAEDALMKDIPTSLRPRLGIFHNAACYGLSTNLMATRAGFAASVGSDDETLGPLVLREFLRNYLNGLTLKETTEEILHTCVNNEEWRQTIKIALDEDDYKKYCSEAIVAIVGNPDITVNDNVPALISLKKEHHEKMKDFGTKMEGNY